MKFRALVIVSLVGVSIPAMCQSKLALRGQLITSSGSDAFSDDAAPVHKSPTLAAFASLAVPGLGELYAGRYDAGKYSTIAEVSLWVLYTGLELYSNQVRNDAINYAKIHAGAVVAGKPSQFFVDMGNFMNTEDFNTKKIHDVTDGSYGYGSIYYGASNQWQWQSDADRAQFKSLRIKADTYLNFGRYTLAVIFLNHLFSAIHAGQLASRVNASAATSLDNSPQTTGIYLRLAASF